MCETPEEVEGIMKYVLNEEAPISYSAGEIRMFNLLARQPEVQTTKQLSELFYKNKKAPFNAHRTAFGMLRTIQEKIAKNREPFRIESSDRGGPFPITFSLARR